MTSVRSRKVGNLNSVADGIASDPSSLLYMKREYIILLWGLTTTQSGVGRSWTKSGCYSRLPSGPTHQTAPDAGMPCHYNRCCLPWTSAHLLGDAEQHLQYVYGGWASTRQAHTSRSTTPAHAIAALTAIVPKTDAAIQNALY